MRQAMLLNNNAILYASRAEPPGESSQRSTVVLSFSSNVAAFSDWAILGNASPRRAAPGDNCRSPTMTTARRAALGSRIALEDALVDRDPFLRATPPATAELAGFPPRLSATEMALPQPS